MRLGLFILAVLILVKSPMQEFAEAQIKKEPPGVIEISEGKDGKFRFFVRDNGDKLVAMSSPGGFATVKDAEAEIDRLRAIVANAKVIAVKKEEPRKDAPKKDAPKKDAPKKDDK